MFEVHLQPGDAHGDLTDRSYDLGDQPVTGVARNGDTGDLYASTDFGVLRLPSGATTWTEAAPGPAACRRSTG